LGETEIGLDRQQRVDAVERGSQSVVADIDQGLDQHGFGHLQGAAKPRRYRLMAAHGGDVAGEHDGGEYRKGHGAHARAMMQGEPLNHLSINSC
jgi:hypothetical protein